MKHFRTVMNYITILPCSFFYVEQVFCEIVRECGDFEYTTGATLDLSSGRNEKVCVVMSVSGEGEGECDPRYTRRRTADYDPAGVFGTVNDAVPRWRRAESARPAIGAIRPIGLLVLACCRGFAAG